MKEPALNRQLRETTLFRDNGSQAVHIPADLEFSGSRVLIHKEVHRLIIEPARRSNLADVLRSLAPLGPADALPDNLDEILLPLADLDL